MNDIVISQDDDNNNYYLCILIDILSEYPDKKSILMYVMCLFQQLPTNNIVIEENKERNGLISTTRASLTNNHDSLEATV
jgi:hypothetical protein